MKLSIFAILLIVTTQIQATNLRPLATDRPDATESPQTVDKGYFQVETSFAAYSRDKASGVTTTSISAFETNFKYGVSDSVDLQLVVIPFLEEKIKTQGGSATESSHGDIELRAKINIWGNNGGDSAFGLLPFIKIPSGDLSNDKYELGVILTYGTLWSDYDIGTQVQIDRAYEASKNDYSLVGSHTAVLGYELTDSVGGYLEYIGDYTTDDDYNPFLSFGFTLQNDENSQWDFGSVFALSDEGEDLSIFAGYTIRFK